MTISLPDLRRRAVITGIGVVAPNGVGTETWWERTLAGASGVGEISRFDASRYATRFAGEVLDFDASEHLPKRLMVQTDRWTWMSLAAAEMALGDAALDPATQDPYSMSVVTASSSGGNEFGQVEIQNLWDRGARYVGAYQSIAWFYAASTGQISIKYGMKGPNAVIVTEGAGGLDALGHARRTVRRGSASVVSGGLEAPIGPYALTCQLANGKLSAEPASAAYKPLDTHASGYLPGEGGAILLVEDRQSALTRGVPQIYGELAGYAATQDGARCNGGGRGRALARAIARALHDASVEPGEVDAIFADGAGDRDGDRDEAAAIHSAFGECAHTIPVTVPKSMVGRLYAGGGSLDVAAALLAIRDGVLPPTINVTDPIAGLDIVTGPRAAQLRTVLVLARGYGGFNSALIVRGQPDA